MRKIVIAGGSGFLGNALVDHFEKLGATLKILTRNPRRSNEVFWDGKTVGDWQSELEWADVLINLSGKSVDCRYTEANKKAIYDSRIDTTNVLNEAMQGLKHPVGLWINASSATIYQHEEVNPMTEEKGIIGDDFSMNICKAWERAFFSVEIPKTRKVAARIGIVLGRESALPKLSLICKLGMGGHQGNGQQKMSWIHVTDFCRSIEWLMNSSLSGPVNITAPNPVSNKAFMKELRNVLEIPFGLPQPQWLLEIGTFFLRTETELILKSRNVFPERMQKDGFEFHFAEAKQALKDLLEK